VARRSGPAVDVFVAEKSQLAAGAAPAAVDDDDDDDDAATARRNGGFSSPGAVAWAAVAARA
jgi:hypothetical protein